MGPLAVASHDRTTVAPVCVSCDCGWIVITLGTETKLFCRCYTVIHILLLDAEKCNDVT